MTWLEYCKDRAMSLLIHVTCMFLLSCYLLLIANGRDKVILILIAWWIILLTIYGKDYYNRRKYFANLYHLLHELDKRYLLGEVMKPTGHLEDKLYRDLIRKSNKSVIEELHESEAARRDYKEYLERWIHDVKIPVTAIELLCENNKDEAMDKVRSEIGKIDSQVEMVLYYARLEKVYQDYLIHPVDLREAVLASIHKNKLYFIQNKMQIDLKLENTVVSTDEKWVEFLLNQILSNSIKYKKEDSGTVSIYTKRGKNKISLIIEDDGVGIAREDLRRVFDKGFTGKNGRTGRKSSGMGLYLCKSLCDKLGIGIECESELLKFTRVILTFPDSDYGKGLNKTLTE